MKTPVILKGFNKPTKTVARACEDFIEDLENIQDDAQDASLEAITKANVLEDQAADLMCKSTKKKQEALDHQNTFKAAATLVRNIVGGMG